jgi:hypothetical protein
MIPIDAAFANPCTDLAADRCEEIIMQSIKSSTLLRRVLLADAACSAGMGVAMLTLGPMFAGLLNLPAGLLREAGFVLLPFAGLVGYLATREQPARIGVWAVIALNIVWTVDSILLLLTGWVEPNALGYAFIIGQAAAVGLFAELEYVGLRKSVLVHA